MDDTEHIYTPNTLISVNTCKPVFQSTHTDIPVFWCAICNAELRSPISAIQHVSGAQHKAKYKRKYPDRRSEDKTGLQSQTLQRTPNTVDNKPEIRSGFQNETQKRKPDTVDRGLVKIDVSSPKKPKLDAVQGIAQKQTKVVQQNGAKDASSSTKDKDPSQQEYKCETCNLTLTSGVHAVDHFKGKKHAALVAKLYNERMNEGAQRGGRERGRGSGGSSYRGHGGGREWGSERGRGSGNSRGLDSGRGVGRGDRFSNDSYNETVGALDSHYSQQINNLPGNRGIGGNNSYSSSYFLGDGGYRTNNNYSTNNSSSYGANNFPSNYGQSNNSAGSTYLNTYKDSLYSEIDQLKRRLCSMY